MIRYLLVILVSSILSILNLPAQITVTGEFEQDTVEIGHNVRYTLSIEASTNQEIIAIPRLFLDSVYSALQTFKLNPNDTSGSTRPQLADYEVIDIGLWTNQDENEVFVKEELKWSTNSIGDRQLYENSFTFKFWDPGNNVVLLPPIVYIENGEQKQYYEGGQVEVFISAPKSLQGINQDSLDITPIKPILIESKNLNDYLIYLYIIAGLLLIVLAYYLLKKWQKLKEEDIATPIEEVIIIPAHEKALGALSNLKAAQLWQQGKIKDYQSQLTFIIREYLENRYGIHALESTTDEIVGRLKKSDLELTDVDSLKRILQVADLVKFAKAKPEESIHDTFMIEAEEFVDRTKEVKIIEE